MFWRSTAAFVVTLSILIQGILTDEVNPCRRQPFRGRCPSTNGATPMRSQFVLRYYLRAGECVSYPYGHCANDDNEPKLFRYKEECEDACVKASNHPTTQKPKDADSLVAERVEIVEVDTQAPQSTGEFTYATGGVESTTGYETPKTECQRQRDSRGHGLIKGGFIPECSANGEFKQLQCEQDRSECFCVNVDGIEIDNSRTKTGQEKPDCEKIISASTQKTNECVGGSEIGPCRSSIPRWFYDETSHSCQQFAYSGCGGNGNNYATQAACEHRCVPTKEAGKCHKGKEPLRMAQGQLINCAKTECPAGYKCSVIQHSSVCCPDDEKSVVGVLHSGVGAAACGLAKERGPCDRYELRFYFNQELNECKYFFYGGCEGNDNNFARVEDCEKTCGAKPSDAVPPVRVEEQVKPSTTTTEQPTTTSTQASTTTSTPPPTTTTTVHERPTFPLPQETKPEIEVRTFPSASAVPELPGDRCLHPRDDGSCGGQFVRWLWNNENRKCESFPYTGCGGNGNNFASLEECLSICHIEVAKPEPIPETVENTCESVVDAGACSGTFMRYAFEPSTNDCHQFAYTGCGGNGNNFATLNECRKKCVPQKGLEPTPPSTASTSLNATLQITPTKNICDHPIEIGECSGIFHRFAYDGDSNECRQFEYGGCGGNGNNFATIAECRSACVQLRCPPAPSCDTSRCQVVNDVRGCPFCSCPPPPQHPPIIPTFQPEPQCPALNVELCVEPCIIFSNRRGCKECVCPVLPSQLPPNSFPPSRPQPRAPAPASPEISMPRPIHTQAPTTTQEPATLPPVARPPAPQQPPRPEPVQTQAPPRSSPPAPPAPIRAPSPPAPPAPPAPRLHTNTIIEGVLTEQPRSSIPIPPQRPRATIADLGEKCTQPVDPGPCKNFVERWHFNEGQGQCEPFAYGGCAGNRNHFFTRKECEIHCARFSRVPRPVVEIDEVVIETPRPIVTSPPTTPPPVVVVQTRLPPRQPPPQAPVFVPTTPPPVVHVRTQPPPPSPRVGVVTATPFVPSTVSLSTPPPPVIIIPSTTFVPNWPPLPSNNNFAPPQHVQQQSNFAPPPFHRQPFHQPSSFVAPALPPNPPTQAPRIFSSTFKPFFDTTAPPTLPPPTTTTASRTPVWTPRVVVTTQRPRQPVVQEASTTTVLPTTTSTEEATTTPFHQPRPQQQWHQTMPPQQPPVFAHPFFVKPFNSAFTQPPPSHPIFVETTTTATIFAPPPPPQTFVPQNRISTIPAPPQPQRPIQRPVPLQPIAQQPHFESIPTLPPKLPLPDISRQFAQPTFNQAAFEKAAIPHVAKNDNEYQPPPPPLRTDFNPYIPPQPPAREGGFAPAGPVQRPPMNPQDQWPANTKKPAGGSYGMEEITPNKEGHHQIVIKPLPTVAPVAATSSQPATQPPPSLQTTTEGKVVETEKTPYVPVFLPSSSPPPAAEATTTKGLPIKPILPINNEYSSGPDAAAKPEPTESKTENVNSEYSSGPKNAAPEKTPETSPATLISSPPQEATTPESKVPEATTPESKSSSSAPTVGGYEEAATEKPQTLKSESTTSKPEPSKPASGYEASETPQESLVVLEKPTSESPKVDESTYNKEPETKIPETPKNEISDITASSTPAPNVPVHPSANVNEYRVFGEKSNPQNAIEPPRNSESSLGKIPASSKLQIVDGGSDRSVGRKPIALPEGFVNAPMTIEMGNTLLEETIETRNDGEGKSMGMGRGQGIGRGLGEGIGKVEFSTSEPVKTQHIPSERVVDNWSSNAETTNEALSKVVVVQPVAPRITVTPPSQPSRLVFTEKPRLVDIPESTTIPSTPEKIDVTLTPQLPSESEAPTTEATRKLIHIHPIHSTTQPPTIDTVSHTQEKIPTPIISGDIEEHEPHGMLEEIAVDHVQVPPSAPIPDERVEVSIDENHEEQIAVAPIKVENMPTNPATSSSTISPLPTQHVESATPEVEKVPVSSSTTMNPPPTQQQTIEQKVNTFVAESSSTPPTYPPTPPSTTSSSTPPSTAAPIVISNPTTLPAILSSSPSPTSTPPPSSLESVEKNHITEAFTVDPVLATRPPKTVVAPSSEAPMVPHPATAFTPRPIFRPDPTSASPVAPVTIFGPPLKTDPEACVMPPDAGKCREFVLRWFYNSEKGVCQEFSYGSCGGNANNFGDKASCESRCALPAVTATLPQRCNFPKDEGFGNGYHPKFYFNSRNLRCEQMVFRGSGGNDNRFSQEEDCEHSCKHFVPQPPPRKDRKETDKRPLPPVNFARGSLNVQEGYGNAPSHVEEIPEHAPAPEPYAPSANAPSGMHPTAPSAGPAPAPVPHSPGMAEYAPAPPPLRPEYNGIGEFAAPAPPAAPAHAPTSSVTATETVGRGASESLGGSAPEQPAAPGVNHQAGIPRTHEEPAPGINHQATIGSKEVEEPSSNNAAGAAPHEVEIPATNNVDEGSNGQQGAKYESAGEPAGPTAPDSGVQGGKDTQGYNAIPAGENMKETPDSKLPILAPSPTMTVDYVNGKRLDGKGAKTHGIATATGENSKALPDSLTDKDTDFAKSVDDSSEELPENIPVCPNGLQAMLYDTGAPVMCLPGKDQCPQDSVCYFNGMDYFCCPNANDPYDQHIFGGYDGEEVKHGYKSVPTSLNIRSIRKRRQAGIPPSSFSIDHITKPLRFDDKPVQQISRAGSVDSLARLRVNPCTQDVVEGECNEAHLRYFYDIKTDTCRLFYYSGCGGNTNNFMTQNECNQRCKLGIVITTSEAPIPPGRCPGGKRPLGDNAPVLCGNQTDSIGCPRGYYCRNGPPDVCCPDEIPDLQTILSQNVNREIRRRPFISAAGKFEGGHDHHHHHEHHHAAHGVATEHADHGYDNANAAVQGGSDSQTHEHEHAHEDHSDAAPEQKHESSHAAAAAPESSTSSPTASTTFGLPDNICPDGSDALTEGDGKTTKMCGSGFDGHQLCPKGFYCSIDADRNSRLCCPMTLQGSNIPPPPATAPYFGHRRHNPGEVVERGSLPSDPKPPKLSTPKPRSRMTMDGFESTGEESNAEFMAPSGGAAGASEGVEKSDYDAADANAPGARPETTETDSQLDAKPDKVAIEENPSASHSSDAAPSQVQPADMPTTEGQEEKGPYAHLRLKPFERKNKLEKLQANASTAIEVEDGHIQIRTNSQEDPFEVDGERKSSKKVQKTSFDLSMCQLRPSEGRQCREDEPQPRTNLQFFYSTKDSKCKLFFHRGCGGNENRFDTKADCEKACSSLMGQ